MLKLAEIPFFSKLTELDLQYLEKYIEVVSYKAGSLISEEGETCSSLLAIAEGKLQAKLSARAHASESELIFKKGTVLSELSLISNITIPASLTALEDSKLILISSENFHIIQEENPPLYDSLMRILTTRLQYSEPFELAKFSSFCSILVYKENDERLRSLLDQICQGIEKSCSKSKFLHDKDFEIEDLKNQVKKWKVRGSVGHPVVISIKSSDLFKLAPLLDGNDKLLFMDCFENYKVFKNTYKKPKLAFLSIGEKPDSKKHYYVIDDDNQRQGSIDRIVRLMTNKEIGLALGAGAARGFTHLGVLQVLEEENIAVDFISGTSIGGVIALTYSLTASARKTTEIIRDTIGAKNKVQDISLLPRQSLLKGKKIKRAAERVFSTKTFSDLTIPVEVVSSNLGDAKRHIMDSGLLQDAVLATSAIPGIFPPLIKDGRILVDGALTSKVPVGLLRKRNTALKIAINATSAKGIFSCDPQSRSCALSGVDGTLYDLQNTFELTKGINLGSIINHSWDLLSWSEASMEAAKADISINPDTSDYSNFSFDNFDELVEIGRQACFKNLTVIKIALSKL